MKLLSMSLSMAIVLTSTLGAQTPTSQRTSKEGVFSAAQAERGKRVFSDACQTCHLPEEFSASGYLRSWEGQSVHDLFEFIRTKMPFDSPGRLKRREYVDVVTYLMQMNGLPAGKGEIEGGDAEMKAIKIVLPLR